MKPDLLPCLLSTFWSAFFIFLHPRHPVNDLFAIDHILLSLGEVTQRVGEIESYGTFDPNDVYFTINNICILIYMFERV